MEEKEYPVSPEIIDLVKKREKRAVEAAEGVEIASEAEAEAERETADPATIAAQGGPMAFAELTPDQKTFLADLQLRDFQQLLAANQKGHNCMNRQFIPGEALPLPDPEGVTNTFLVLYCEVAYARVFYGAQGIAGLTFNDFVDSDQPGMQAFRVELREEFQSKLPQFVKFCQASINQFAADQLKPKIVTLDEARKIKADSDWKRGPKH